jgi:hypothetical protein
MPGSVKLPRMMGQAQDKGKTHDIHMWFANAKATEVSGYRVSTTC